jgi:hypothetical protein
LTLYSTPVIVEPLSEPHLNFKFAAREFASTSVNTGAEGALGEIVDGTIASVFATGERPTEFLALIDTEYVRPLVRPVIFVVVRELRTDNDFTILPFNEALIT